MATYRSKARYEALRAVPENLETLASWGWTPSVPSDGIENMFVVRDNQSLMVSAILFEDDFYNQFEEVTVADPLVSSDEPPVIDSP